MALDISAYRKLIPVRNAELDEDGNPVNWYEHVLIDARVIEYTEAHWPGRASDIAPGIYRFDDCFDFRAGTYSAYSCFRDWLAKIGGWGNNAEDCQTSAKATGPFWELINFSDCEGLIGPHAAAKLARDFVQFEFVAHRDCLNGLYAHYRQWRKAFLMASDGGVVDFH